MNRPSIGQLVPGVLLLACLVPLAHCTVPATSISPPPSADNADHVSDWSGYGRTSDQQHYSPLRQIRSDNIAGLHLAWYFDIPGTVLAVSTPLEVDGVLYFATGYSVIRALDAATGRLLWTYDPHVPRAAGERLRKGWGIRGIAYWRGRILAGTHDGRLLGIDSRTGRKIWSVTTVAPHDGRYITGPPLVFKNTVVIGNAGGDVAPVRGYITAYDLRTGKERWRFYTVPGKPGTGDKSVAMRMAAQTWTGRWWRFGGGGTVWNALTYDKALNRVYIGTGNGLPWNPSIRSPHGGDNLFICSIVALDADTGAYEWHYQLNPSDAWDYDADEDIELATLKIAGRRRRVLMQASKNGFFYVIDRETGRLLSAGEFAKVTWARGIDLATGRPLEAPDARYSHGAVTLWPGSSGAHSWQPMAFDPTTRLAYIPSIEMPGRFSAADIETATWRVEPGLVPNVGVDFDLTDDVPGSAGAGYLVAWDPIRARAAWKVRLPGVWNGGVLATAGNLVFQGRADGKFVAYAADSGSPLWAFSAQAGIVGAPIAYRVAGKQYVSVLAGFGGSGASLGTLSAQFGWGDRQKRRVLTFALGGTARLPPLPRDSRRVVTPRFPFTPDPKQVRLGGILYGKDCAFCHGAAAIAGGDAPDLRKSPLILAAAAFDAVVNGGRLVSQGMPRFAELDSKAAGALRLFLLAQAWRAHCRQPAPAVRPPHAPDTCYQRSK